MHILKGYSNQKWKFCHHWAHLHAHILTQLCLISKQFAHICSHEQIFAHVNTLTRYPLSEYGQKRLKHKLIDLSVRFCPACIHINLSSVGLLKYTCDMWQESVLTADLRASRESECFVMRRKYIANAFSSHAA